MVFSLHFPYISSMTQRAKDILGQIQELERPDLWLIFTELSTMLRDQELEVPEYVKDKIAKRRADKNTQFVNMSDLTNKLRTEYSSRQ